MDKSLLRQLHIKKRLTLSEGEAEKISKKIAERLFLTDIYKNAESIMVYISAKGEVLTDTIIAQALADKKRLFAPVCRENFMMDAVGFNSPTDLKTGKYGICAPVGNKIIPPEKIDLVIVPGCVFSKSKHRIGYGKGYYDRFLAKLSKTSKTVGICYSFNLETVIPTGEFDMPLDIIITENEVIL